MKKYTNYIIKYNSYGMIKYADKLNIYNKKFSVIYKTYLKMLKEYITNSIYSDLIIKLSESTIKKIFKNVVLEYIRNNEYQLFKYISNKYKKINFDCIDLYNFYKHKNNSYVFSCENNNIITYKITFNNFIQIKKKVPFEYKISNDYHYKGCQYMQPHNTLTFISESINYHNQKNIIYNFNINECYESLKKYTYINDICIVFLTQYNIQEIGHCNSIIFDNNKKYIIRFEPLIKESKNLLTCLIKKLANEFKYKYISIKNKYNINFGLQKTGQTGEWCNIWCYYLTLLYLKQNNLNIFLPLIDLNDYNTNFMFYYIFDLLYTEKIINQDIINILIDKVLKYIKNIKYINNDNFIYIIQNLTDYSILAKIIQIFNNKYDNLIFFKKNIYENFDSKSLNNIINIISNY
jgi:hypothetical protein